MAITSVITADQVAGTVTAQIELNGSQLIDQPVYSVSSNQVVFPGSISSASLSVQDFLTLLTVYISYNTLIVNIFGPSQFVTSPFGNIVSELSDSGSGALEFQFLPGSIPLAIYNASYPSGNVALTTRALSSTLSYAQYLYFLYQLANFRLAVHNAYQI